ncbi:3-deoxy-7-phosphoheptulonate synthase [Providencia rettgeri]
MEKPIGIKCGPNITSYTLLKLIKKLNPSQEKGKTVLIIRMGAGVIKQKLPALIKSIQPSGSGKPVIWMIVPMHGNTKNAKEGYKTRYFTGITNEMIQFIHILKEAGVHLGGAHLEMTGLDVTECTGRYP